MSSESMTLSRTTHKAEALTAMPAAILNVRDVLGIHDIVRRLVNLQILFMSEHKLKH